MKVSKSSFFGTTCKLALGAGISLLLANASQAVVLNWQLRAVAAGINGDVTTVGTIIDGNGNATLPANLAPGAKIVFQLSYVFTGGTNNNTGMVAVTEGSAVSTGSSGRFTLAGAGSLVGKTVANYNSVGSATGTAGVDLSSLYPYTGGTASTAPVAGGVADGILDVGNTIAAASSPTGYFVTVTSAISGFGNGTPTNVVGEFILTLGGDAVGVGNTSIGYFLRPTSSGTTTAKNYNTGSVDGVNFAYNYQGNIANTAAPGAFGSMVSAGVSIVAAPEPSAFAMLALGALGLVGFRRAGVRRAA